MLTDERSLLLHYNVDLKEYNLEVIHYFDM